MAGEIRVRFGGRAVPLARVRDWEAKRAVTRLHRLGRAVPAGDVRVLRKALLDARTSIGRDATERRLARQITLSDRTLRTIARLSGRRRRLCQVELFAPGATAVQLPSWYLGRLRADDEPAFLAACPDHHLFRPSTNPRGQEVWETTGGAPFASRFYFAAEVTTGLVTPADPGYPVQLAGAAKLADGTIIGGIRHQFRDEDDGTRALLTVEFPWLIGPLTPSAHRWHLACEFTNWFDASTP
jgi:hypothetical protein